MQGVINLFYLYIFDTFRLIGPNVYRKNLFHAAEKRKKSCTHLIYGMLAGI